MMTLVNKVFHMLHVDKQLGLSRYTYLTIQISTPHQLGAAFANLLILLLKQKQNPMQIMVAT